MKPWSYHGRWALVTGASAGIGEEFARQLARRGMNVVLTARREARLRALAAEIEAEYGVQTGVVAADLAEPGAADRVWEAACAIGQVDLLVNNAGFGAQGWFTQVDRATHAAMVQVNSIAPMELAHHAVAAMRPRGEGGILNVASIAAFQPVPRLATYAASKAFLLSLSESLWVENQKYGLRVVALCPGLTPTEFQEVAGTEIREGSFGVRTPEQVVKAGLDALERGRSYEIPGWENKAAMAAVRLIPRGPVTRIMKSVVRRLW